MRDFIILNELSSTGEDVISTPMYLNVSQIIAFGKGPDGMSGPVGTNCTIITGRGAINVAETSEAIIDKIFA